VYYRLNRITKNLLKSEMRRGNLVYEETREKRKDAARIRYLKKLLGVVSGLWGEYQITYEIY
jgi:hypothetical protein